MKLKRVVSLGMLLLLLVACSTIPLGQRFTPTSPLLFTPTSPISLTPTPVTPIPLATPTAKQVHSLTICTGSEPADLYLYNDLSYIKRVILSTIYDGPIDARDFGYQPVILEKLPSLADGDASIETVQVQDGDRVVGDNGLLSVFGKDLLVRPAGCRSSDCAIPYGGGGVEMDRMRVDFHIRPGVRWADGADVTAADSVYSYQVAVDENTLYGNNGLVSGSAQSVMFTASYIALDNLTVEWVGLPGFLDPNYPTNFFIPLPEHRLSGYTVSQLSEANEVLDSPLGWGPYRVTSWEQGKQMTLGPNPNYYRALEGLPYFDQLTFRFIGQDVTQNLAALRDGQCDLLLPDALPDLPNLDMISMISNGVARLYTDPAIQAGTSLQPVLEQLTFNLDPTDPNLPPLFADVGMRRAMAACLDRSALAWASSDGLVAALDQPLPADHPLMSGADLMSHPFDPAAGKSLLASLGWSDTDGDGILEAHGSPGVPDGTPLSFELVLPDSLLRSTIGPMIAGQLSFCGMDVKVVQSPGRDLFAQNADAPLAGRHFELAELSAPMSVEGLCAMVAVNQISSADNGWTGSNLGGYSNPSLEGICSQVRSTLPGTQEYTFSRQTALRIFAQDLPFLPLFPYARFMLARPDLTGVSIGYAQPSELQNIESFRLEP